MLSMCWFDADKCEQGLNALKEYHRQWDSDKKMFKEKEYVNWSNHFADAFRYTALHWREEAKSLKSQPLLRPDQIPIKDLWMPKKQAPKLMY
jgi:phage terminase large subunit